MYIYYVVFLEFSMNWRTAFSNQEKIFSIPTLRTLKIVGNRLTERDIAEISMTCLNLNRLEIDLGGSFWNFPEVGRAIWTHMKNLQSLSFSYRRVDKTCAVDFTSAVTGISRENCQILLNKIKKMNEKPMPASKKREAITGFKISKLEVEKMRENISILDLKGTKLL